MVCLLGIINGLSLWSNASVPCGLGLFSAPRGYLTVLLCLSDLFTDPGEGWIASFPSRLFFSIVFVLLCLGVAHWTIPGSTETGLGGFLDR